MKITKIACVLLTIISFVSCSQQLSIQEEISNKYRNDIQSNHTDSDLDNDNLNNYKSRAGVVADSRGLIQLSRAYNSSVQDHFYTIDYSEIGRANGYNYEHAEAVVYNYQASDTYPLYRLVNGRSGSRNHFYTLSENEKNHFTNTLGYAVEGIACYIFKVNKAGTVPLYRAYSEDRFDHLYTTSYSEYSKVTNKKGFIKQGVVGYVYPKNY